MQERTLLRIALFCSVIGITSLYIISENIEIEEISINKIDFENIGEEIKIRGKINKISNFEKIFLLEIEDERTKNKISAVVFKDGKLSIKKDDYVEITGEIKEYKGNLELISEVIKKY